jgi:hypothetical protein
MTTWTNSTITGSVNDNINKDSTITGYHSLTLLLYYLFMLSFTDPVIVLFVYVVIHWPCYCTICLCYHSLTLLLYYSCLCYHSLTLLLYYLFMLSFTDPVIVLFVYFIIHWPCYCTILVYVIIHWPCYCTIFVYVVIHWPCYCTICLCCHSLTLLLYYLFMLSFTDPVDNINK